MYYDELCARLFNKEAVEIEERSFEIEEVDERASPCSGCPLLSQNNKAVCNLCIAYDFYVFVDQGVNKRFRLKEVKK